MICTGGAVGGEEAGEGARGHIAATEWPPGAPRRSAGARRPPTSDGTWGTRVTAHEEPTRRIQATAHTGPCPCTHGNGTHGPGRCSMSARSNECTSVSPPQASGPAGTRGRARAEGAHLFPRRRRLALRKPTSRVTRRQRASARGDQERQTESTPKHIGCGRVGPYRHRVLVRRGVVELGQHVLDHVAQLWRKARLQASPRGRAQGGARGTDGTERTVHLGVHVAEVRLLQRLVENDAHLQGCETPTSSSAAKNHPEAFIGQHS